MKKNIRLYTVSGGLLLTLFFMNNALAYDYKVFAGTECETYKENDPAVKVVGGIRNVGTTSLRIVCPILRDRARNFGDTVNINRLWIRVAATAATSCVVHNTNTAGNTIVWAAVGSGINAYGGWVQLTPLTNETPLSLACSLGSGNMLTAYETAEPDSTDDGF